ncbi:MAG: S9 family peptidase [Rickettsiaceae bacterium]|nr:S9 family peptidase [Rickettsiaceae bacterium]
MEKNQTSALISRKKLFGNPDYANVKISPDGKYLSYLAPKDGVLNIYLAKVEDIDNAKAITSDKNRGIRSYFWAFNSSTIIYSQDENGDENARLYKIDVEANKITPLTPQGVKAFAIALSHNFPNHLLVSMNDRDPKFFDVYKLDINNATMERVLKNEKYTDFVADKNLKLRFAMYITPNGDTDIFNIDDIANPKLYKNIKSIDSANSEILFFANDNEFYLLDSQNRDTAALYKETTEGKRDLVAQNDKADISYISLHPTNYTQQYYSYEYQRTSKVFFDKTVEADFEFLKNASETESDIDIISRTLDDNMWVVIFDSSDRPASYYLFNRSAKKLDFLFYTRKNLVEENLTYMIPVIIKSRDGLDLPSYLSLPREVFTKPDNPHNKLSKKPVPMVLFVHGGPQARDFWGFDSTHQWLANRGYAVLSVNYRGSDGFGKNFIELGNGEWGGKMHLDLIDAVNWAIENNIALKDKIGIYGGSYGGYSALVGATFTPDVFACAADVVGPSNLITLLNSLPEYWIPAISKLIQKTGGDPSTEEGRKFLAQRSPINFVDNIKKPLLIAQGANDPRVKEAESTQIVKKMQEKKIQVTYLLYSDEGHGFARPENRMSFTALLEQFFAKHLGGRFEALGDELNNSSIKIVDKGGLEIEVENK